MGIYFRLQLNGQVIEQADAQSLTIGKSGSARIRVTDCDADAEVLEISEAPNGRIRVEVVGYADRLKVAGRFLRPGATYHHPENSTLTVLFGDCVLEIRIGGPDPLWMPAAPALGGTAGAGTSDVVIPAIDMGKPSGRTRRLSRRKDAADPIGDLAKDKRAAKPVEDDGSGSGGAHLPSDVEIPVDTLKRSSSRRMEIDEESNDRGFDVDDKPTPPPPPPKTAPAAVAPPAVTPHKPSAPPADTAVSYGGLQLHGRKFGRSDADVDAESPAEPVSYLGADSPLAELGVNPAELQRPTPSPAPKAIDAGADEPDANAGEMVGDELDDFGGFDRIGLGGRGGSGASISSGPAADFDAAPSRRSGDALRDTRPPAPGAPAPAAPPARAAASYDLMADEGETDAFFQAEADHRTSVAERSESAEFGASAFGETAEAEAEEEAAADSSMIDDFFADADGDADAGFAGDAFGAESESESAPMAEYAPELQRDDYAESRQAEVWQSGPAQFAESDDAPSDADFDGHPEVVEESADAFFGDEAEDETTGGFAGMPLPAPAEMGPPMGGAEPMGLGWMDDDAPPAAAAGPMFDAPPVPAADSDFAFAAEPPSNFDALPISALDPFEPPMEMTMAEPAMEPEPAMEMMPAEPEMPESMPESMPMDGMGWADDFGGAEAASDTTVDANALNGTPASASESAPDPMADFAPPLPTPEPLPAVIASAPGAARALSSGFMETAFDESPTTGESVAASPPINAAPIESADKARDAGIGEMKKAELAEEMAKETAAEKASSAEVEKDVPSAEADPPPPPPIADAEPQAKLDVEPDAPQLSAEPDMKRDVTDSGAESESAKARASLATPAPSVAEEISAEPAEKMQEVLVSIDPRTGKPIPPGEIHRKSTVRYFTRMNPNRNFPLLVVISKYEIQQKVMRKVAQVSGKKSFAIKTSNPIVEVVPRFPGCLCVPDKLAVDVRPNTCEMTFWITPQTVGFLSDAKVEIWYEGKCIDTIACPAHVVRQTFARMAAAASVISPVFFSTFEGVTGQSAQQAMVQRTNEIATYGLPWIAQQVDGFTNLGLIAGGVCLLGAGLFWLLSRPKQGNPVDSFLAFATDPTKSVEPPPPDAS